MLIDVGKGALAAGVIPALDLPLVGIDPLISRTWLALACAAAAVVGHVWPVWHRFRGGKGAATQVGTLIALDAWLVLPLLLVWAWVLTLSGYVGLSTMIAAAFAPLYLALTRLPAEQPLFVYSVVMALFMIFSHRSNIRRMRAGTESRNRRVMLFRRGQEPAEGLDDDDD
jgi:glycerol-3-phosphate acyltransferase PlsY